MCWRWVWLTSVLALFVVVLLGGGCMEEVALYFSDSNGGPAVESIASAGSDADQVASEEGLQGGAPVYLVGEGLDADVISVNFGGLAADVSGEDIDPAGRSLAVRSPPGPISGGLVDVSVSTPGGVLTLVDAYEYVVPDPEVFELEAGSMQVIGYEEDHYQSALEFWPSLTPRVAGSMFHDAALYYLPGEHGQVVSWEGGSPVAMRPASVGRAVANLVTLEPVDYPEYGLLALAADQETGVYEACAARDVLEPWWVPGAEYSLRMSGGVLEETLQTRLLAPPAAVPAGEVPDGLRVNGYGVAEVDKNRDLVLNMVPGDPSDADVQYLMMEVVVEAPERSIPGQPFELDRVVVRGDEKGVRLVLRTADLELIRDVDTTCAVLARRWKSAELRGDDEDAAQARDAYEDAHCRETEDPLAAYPSQGYIRVSRHYVHRVPLPAGAAGCATPGECPGDAELVIDLVSAYEVMAGFGALTACQDGLDNDGDGAVDEDDPGCQEGVEDDSERDETGFALCDNGKDDDGDGLSDYAVDGTGDPGCEGPSDRSETSSSHLCDNGLDDDGDGYSDYRPGSASHDPGCSSLLDSSEQDSSIECDDGVDNDGDGRTDYLSDGEGDIGCTGPSDSSELGDNPCDDGVDNDADGYIDFSVLTGIGDPGCEDSLDPDEKYDPPIGENLYPCDDGRDNDGDGTIDTEDPGCRETPLREETHSPYEGDEFSPTLECDDNEDNEQPNGDGLVDYKENGTGDPECLSVFDDDESD